jgi:hypothetical protein
MKTFMRTGANIMGATAALALAFGVCFPAQGQTPKKGATELMTSVTTSAQVESLKPGDSIGMVCTKCKSVMVHNVTTEKGHIKVMTVGEKHLCPGCDSTITVVGVGRGPNGAHDVVKHECGKCGSESVFCCATKPGSKATEGMVEKK